MTTDLTHPAEECPGGLWPGAVVVATRDVWDDEDGMPLAMCGVPGVVLPDGMVWHDSVEMPPLPNTWALRLDDPLSLGLAGLAARVAERCGWDWRGSTVYVGNMAAAMRFCGEHNRVPQRITEAASYLALSDRLAAAVGLELAEREVAGWDRLTDGWTAWQLKTSAGVWEGPGPKAPWADTTDPLDALRLALRAVEGGGE